MFVWVLMEIVFAEKKKSTWMLEQVTLYKAETFKEPGRNWIKITLLVWRQIYEFKNFDISGRSKRGKVRWKRWWRW